MLVVEIFDVPITELVEALNRIRADLLPVLWGLILNTKIEDSYVYYPNIRICLFRCFLHQWEEGICEYHGT